jgi:glycine/D-amino acid oxidase-like deaminating enzyme
MTAVSVAVVGAGALGLCTAFELTELGVTDVVVLERDQVASASSGLSVGIVETQYLDPLAIELRVHSMRFFARLDVLPHEVANAGDRWLPCERAVGSAFVVVAEPV